MSVALAEPAGVGHNMAPIDPFDAHVTHMSDLLIEARNWADGEGVQTQAQADAVSRLISDLREAGDAADELRLEEKKPLDEQIDAIQAKFNVWIAGLKSKVKNPGKVVVAIDALKATLKPFLDKMEEERLAEAKRLRDAADEAARVAAEAARAAAPEDLTAREEAEDLIGDAARQAAEAKRVETARTHANGGARAMGLTKTYTARVDDPRALLLHYWGSGDKPPIQREAIIACLQQLAQADVNRKIHTIPGVFVVEGTRL